MFHCKYFPHSSNRSMIPYCTASLFITFIFEKQNTDKQTISACWFRVQNPHLKIKILNTGDNWECLCCLGFAGVFFGGISLLLKNPTHKYTPPPSTVEAQLREQLNWRIWVAQHPWLHKGLSFQHTTPGAISPLQTQLVALAKMGT